MVKTLTQSTPATGLSCYVASEHSAFTAPNTLLQGTGLPFAGTSVAVVLLPAPVAFRARVVEAVERIAARHPGGRVVLFSHAGAINAAPAP